MKRELDRILEDVAAAPRIWIIGVPPLIPDLSRQIDRRTEFRIVRIKSHGVVQLVLLTREEG